MIRSNFNVFKNTNRNIYITGKEAEFNLFRDPNTTMTKCRMIVEAIVKDLTRDMLQGVSVNLKATGLITKNLYPSFPIDDFEYIKSCGDSSVHAFKRSREAAEECLYKTVKLAHWYLEQKSDLMIIGLYICPSIWLHKNKVAG